MIVADVRRRPRRVDVAVGVACTVAAVGLFLALPLLAAADPAAALLVVRPSHDVRWWLVVLGLLGQGALVVLAGRAPRAALVGVAAVVLALSWVAPGVALGTTSTAVVVLVLRVVVRTPPVRLRGSVAAAVLLVLVAETVNADGSGSGAPFLAGSAQTVGIIGLPLVAGLVVRSRRDVREARAGEQQARAGERDALVLAAVARERTAMARELHDIAAHHLSGIALMAAVVDRQIDTAPEQAHRGARQLRAQSTAVLDDLRRLVGLLRDDAGGEHAVETLAAVPELVDRARAHGPVELRVLVAEGRTLGAGVGPLAQLAAYRTIQEALTNAARHAAGSSRVVELDDRHDARTVITVTNAAAPGPAAAGSSGGFGLVGMRERAELVGAELRVGPTPAGGWQVRVSVPREALAPRDSA